MSLESWQRARRGEQAANFDSRLTGVASYNQSRPLPYLGGERLRNLLFVLFLLALLFSYRIEYSWSFFSTVSLLEIVLFPLFILSSVGWIGSRRLFVGNNNVFFMLILPVLFAFISLVWSIDVKETVKSFVVYSTSLASFLVTLTLGSRFSFQKIAFLFVFIPSVLIVTAVFAYIPGSPIRPEAIMHSYALEQEGFLVSYYARLSHPFLGLSNNFATILAMLLPFSLLVRRSGLWRRVSWWVAVITFAAIVATGSRGVLVAVVTTYGGLFLWNLLNRSRIPRGGLMFVIIALGIGGLFLLISPESYRHLANRLDTVGLTSRLQAFLYVFDILLERPFGIGSGVGLNVVSALSLESVHNAYLQSLLWFGLIGGTLLNMGLLALPFLVGKISVQSHLGREARRALVLSLVILLVINFSEASWEGSILRVWIYFLIGLGLVCIRQADRYELKAHGE